MAFVPLIGLAPFIFFNIFRKEYTFKIVFFTGIFFGSIPTIINFYFSFQKFGMTGITTLFDFARNQAIGDSGYNNLILLPLNFLYLTFPIGILLIILFIFTKPNFKVRYPLLVYCYPLISLTLLLFMSTSYPHYYLFLLPSLSIIFSNYLISNSFRYSFSSSTISYLLILIILFISSIILFSFIIFRDFIIQYSYGNPLIVYILTSLILLSYFTSIKFLVDIKSFSFRFNLINFFYNIIIPQYISLSLFFNFGLLGNPNYQTKQFIKDDTVSSIIKKNTIFLFRVDSKIQTLLSYYLPSSNVLEDLNEISTYKYIITSDSNSLEKMNLKKFFITIKKFDNHSLLMNISN